MNLNIIFARSLNRVIGNNNTIPWAVAEDMKHFKDLTMGCPVIMGRKTWESLPDRYKPLPGRNNIVLTSDVNYQLPEDVLLCHSLPMALEFCKNSPEVWIIGGKKIYEESMGIADKIEETVVHIDCEGDTFMPELTSDWERVARRSQVSAKGNTYLTFTTYKKKPNKLTD